MRIDEMRALDPKSVVVIDTETTGLKPNENDEILSLSMVDLEGTVLFDELVRPERRKRWPKAQEVHGISWAMVKDRQPLAAYQDRIAEIWDGAEMIVGYNVDFDASFMYASGLLLKTPVLTFDVMREFAPIWGRWDDYHDDYRWAKLSDCAQHYGVNQTGAHSSLGDAETTRLCYLALVNDERYLASQRAKEEYRRNAQERTFHEHEQKSGGDGCSTTVVVAIVALAILAMGFSACVSAIF